MKKLLAALGTFTLLPAIVLANEDKIKKGFYTMDAMGCMLLKECTDGVERINSSIDLVNAFPNSDWDVVKDEFDQIMIAFKAIGVHVHLADEKYFPVGHRGVYHTVSNHFYLNRRFVHRPHILMSVVRHEGWHAAQDCMAGTINNGLIATLSQRMKFLSFGEKCPNARTPSMLYLGKQKQSGPEKLKA